MPIPNENTQLDAALSDFDVPQNIQLGNETFSSLNWPDTTDLLNSILSAELSTLPPLETLPSQSIIEGGRGFHEASISPWLTSEVDQLQQHGGNDAVQSLSQIINNLVGNLLCDIWRYTDIDSPQM